MVESEPDSFCSSHGPEAGSCDRGDEPSDCIYGGEFFYLLRKCPLLKTDCDPRSSVVKSVSNSTLNPYLLYTKYCIFKLQKYFTLL